MSRKIIDYDICYSADNSVTIAAQGLAKAVKLVVGKGWEPIGGPTVISNGTLVAYTQAMVKYEQETAPK